MKDKIIAALAQLDALDDDQWTADGAPRMEVVQKLIGDEPKVTRQNVTDAAPKFTRENFQLEEKTEVAKADPEFHDEQEKVFDEAQYSTYIATAKPEDLESIEEDIRAELAEVDKFLKDGKDRRDKVMRLLSVVKTRRGSLKPKDDHGSAVREFIDAQNKNRMQKHVRRDSILRGLSPADVQAMSNLDAAFARNTKRGGKRPTRPILR